MLNLNKFKASIYRYVLCFFLIFTCSLKAIAFTPPPVPGDDVGDVLPIDSWQYLLFAVAIIVGFFVHKTVNRSKFTD